MLTIPFGRNDRLIRGTANERAQQSDLSQNLESKQVFSGLYRHPAPADPPLRVGQRGRLRGVAIVSVLVIRFLVVALVLGLVRLLQREHKSSLLTLSWGGLRGGLSIALALSVPELQSHTWILATTYLVVVFSIVLQGGTLDLFLKKVGRFDPEASVLNNNK